MKTMKTIHPSIGSDAASPPGALPTNLRWRSRKLLVASLLCACSSVLSLVAAPVLGEPSSPDHQIRFAGDFTDAIFSSTVIVTDESLPVEDQAVTVRWRRNGVLLPGSSSVSTNAAGEVTASITVPKINGRYIMPSASKYEAVFGLPGGEPVTSDPAVLVMVDISAKTILVNPEGSLEASTSVDVNNPDDLAVLSYSWSGDIGIANGAVLNERTLNVTMNVLDPEQALTCTVELVGGDSVSTADHTFMIPGVPVLQEPIPALEVTVGVPAFIDLNNFVTNLGATPVSNWSVVGKLPKGLSLDASSGIISGTPVGGQSTVQITASNPAGSESKPVTITVTGTPIALVGDYSGIVQVEDQPGLPVKNGGLFTLKVTAKSKVSGRISHNLRNYRFKGDLDVVSALSSSAQAQVQITKNLSLTMTLDFANNEVVGNLVDNSSSSPFSGNVVAWKKISDAAAPALLGTYHFALVDSAPDATLKPAGYSVGTLRVRNKGRARVAMRLADNSPLSTAGLVGVNGEFPIYRALYSRTALGCMVGALRIDSTNNNQIAELTVAPQIAWYKPNQQGGDKSKLYVNGFTNGANGPAAVQYHDLAGGGLYTVPASGVFLNLTSGPDNAAISFGDLGDDPTIPAAFIQDPDRGIPSGNPGLTLAAGKTVTVQMNPGSLRLNRNNGEATGSVIRRDEFPDNNGAQRSGTIFARAIPMSDGTVEALGFYLMDRRPGVGVPAGSRVSDFVWLRAQ